MSMESFFQIRQRGSTVTREVVGGATTFAAMSYIIFVQPTVLSMCATGGMDRSAVMFATCLCSAIACVIMGLWANLPIGLAPAMGHNFFFAFTVCGTAAMGGFGLSWPEALAANCIAGLLFLMLSAGGLREVIMQAIPEGLKFAIAAGIGLLITCVGLEWSGIVVSHPNTYITLGNLTNPITLLSLFGLGVIAVLLTHHIRGAILIGTLITAAAGYTASRLWGQDWGYVLVHGAAAVKLPNVGLTFGKVFGGFGLLFGRPWSAVILVVFVFLLLDTFDTIGTLVGLGERSGLLVNGQLPRVKQAMMADAIGTVAGTVAGTSTITSYIESSAGMAEGARTGLAALVTGGLMLLSILAYPVVEMLGTAVSVPAGEVGGLVGGSVLCFPVIAPVLIVIGCYMLGVIRRIEWDDFTEALPAFLTIVIMQFAMSITDGIAWGFISYALLKLLSGNAKKCPLMVYVCSVLFVVYYWLGNGS